jgi:ankyrin repeat protein
VLHLACENGLASLVKLLLDRGADPNVKTSRLTCAHTPMHKAILNSHEAIVDIFIEFKCWSLK